MARKSYSDKEREQVKEALLITVLESIVSVCLDPRGRTQRMGTLLQKAGAILSPDETARTKMGRPCQGAGPWKANALRGIHTSG